MAKPVTINGQSFATQKAAEDYCRILLDKWLKKRSSHNRGPWTKEEVLLDGPDLEFARQLFKRHPKFKEKKAEAQSRGAIGICVAPADHGSRCFYLATRKPPMVQFSFIKCIRNTVTKENSDD